LLFRLFGFKLIFRMKFLINNTFPTPFWQCIVMENGKLSVCGRCIDVPGLCDGIYRTIYEFNYNFNTNVAYKIFFTFYFYRWRK